MKKFALKTLTILFITASLSSCNNDDGGETIMLKTSFINSVEGPAIGVIDQDITLTTTFTAENSCGTLNKFVETTSSNTKTIYAQVKYVGECGSSPVTITAPYTFRVNRAGTYTFKFKKNESQFITHSVIVE